MKATSIAISLSLIFSYVATAFADDGSCSYQTAIDVPTLSTSNLVRNELTIIEMTVAIPDSMIGKPHLQVFDPEHPKNGKWVNILPLDKDLLGSSNSLVLYAQTYQFYDTGQLTSIQAAKNGKGIGKLTTVLSPGRYRLFADTNDDINDDNVCYISAEFFLELFDRFEHEDLDYSVTHDADYSAFVSGWNRRPENELQSSVQFREFSDDLGGVTINALAISRSDYIDLLKESLIEIDRQEETWGLNKWLVVYFADPVTPDFYFSAFIEANGIEYQVVTKDGENVTIFEDILISFDGEGALQ